MINQLELALDTHDERPIVIKGAPIVRPVFKNGTTEFKGVMCRDGVILADYLVVASDYATFNRTKYLGTRLPISSSTLHSDKDENPEFRFGDDQLKVGKFVMSEKVQNVKTGHYKMRNLEIMPDNKPIIGRNPASDSVFFNFGYGAWQTGLAFWGAQEIHNLIENQEAPEQAQYSAKRFIKL